MNKIIFLAAAAIIICSDDGSTRDKDKPDVFNPDDLVLWVFGDLQPRDEDEREDFDVAVKDMASMKDVDASICMGDIMQHGKEYTISEEYAWFYNTYSKSGIKDIYEIAVNHDARNIQEYLKATGKPLHYSLQYGNLIIIMLSDEEDSSGSDICDEAFRWWKSIIENNRDKIIITVTHSHVEMTGFCYNIPPYRNVQGSERFTEVLKRERVELWLFGHTHIPSCMLQSKRQIYSLNGTVFINAASIREDYFFSYSESRIVILKNGSDKMTVKFRDHRNRKYKDFFEVTIDLKTKFRYSGEKPVMKAFVPGQGR